MRSFEYFNMKATFSHLELHFKRPAGTSRGVMQVKNSWILKLSDGIHTGTGEISVIEGLSPDFKDIKSFEEKIVKVCSLINNGQLSIVNLGLEDDPSIKFGIETALLDLQNGAKGIIFNNDFVKGKKKIPINGLVWMGDEAFMQEQIQQKLNEGFSTIKMKIGAIDLEQNWNY